MGVEDGGDLVEECIDSSTPISTSVGRMMLREGARCWVAYTTCYVCHHLLMPVQVLYVQGHVQQRVVCTVLGAATYHCCVHSRMACSAVQHSTRYSLVHTVQARQQC